MLANIARLLTVSLIVLLSACAAAPTDPEAMTAKEANITGRHSGSVAVITSGGSETDALGKSQVSNADFKVAIEKSIVATGVFESVVSSETGDYALSAFVTNLDQPSFGMSFTVKVEVAWSLKKVASGETVWEKVINSEHTATSSDAFAGVVRLRLATEGAVKNNISAALEQISALKM